MIGGAVGILALRSRTGQGRGGSWATLGVADVANSVGPSGFLRGDQTPKGRLLGKGRLLAKGRLSGDFTTFQRSSFANQRRNEAENVSKERESPEEPETKNTNQDMRKNCELRPSQGSMGKMLKATRGASPREGGEAKAGGPSPSIAGGGLAPASISETTRSRAPTQ